MNGLALKLTLALLGILTTTTMTFGGWLYIDMSARVKEVATIQAARGERISALETRWTSIQAQLDRLERLVEAIDARQRAGMSR